MSGQIGERRSRRGPRRLPGRASRAGGERGSVALYFVIITVATIAVLGLVVDGGAALAGRERAASLASQAARAGADALTPGSVRGQPTTLLPNHTAAQQAALQLLTAAGASGRVEFDGDRVTVYATVPVHAVILSAFHIGDLSQTVSASATPIYGGTTQYGGG